MARPEDPALHEAYDAGFADGVATFHMEPSYTRHLGEFNVFERMPVSKAEMKRPELNATLGIWKRLLTLYFLADLHRGVPPDEAADRDERRMEHFAKAFTEKGL